MLLTHYSLKVLIGFLVPAYLTLIIITLHYLFDFKSSLNLSANELDRTFIGWVRKRRGSQPSAKWGEAMRTIVLAFSDIQLITGIAILVAGFSQLHCGIASYHWQIIVYLAWFSSLTHIATLSLLREYFHQKPLLKWLRITFMFVMLLLLIAALIPSGNAAWSIDGVPAQCFYDDKNYSVHSKQTSTMVISICFLLVSYATRAIKLFKPGSIWVSHWLREQPHMLLKRRLDKLKPLRRRRTITEYKCILVIFVFFLAVCDIYTSTIWEVCPDFL